MDVIKQQSISSSDIHNILNRGVTVVTGNTRLAGAIRQTYEQTAINNGLDVWLTPDILPWTIWLQRIWGEAVVSGALLMDELLLTPQQEQRIWQDIIAESFSDQPLQQLSGTVHRAQEAWQLIQSWQLPLDQSVFRYNTDSAVFWNWASTFEARCSNKNWLSIASLSDQLTKSFQAGTLATPSELVLIGFDELTPQQSVLLQSLIESGCDIQWMQLAGKQSLATRVACVDARDEAKTVARWVRQKLDDSAETVIGIVVPELESHRTMLTQALDEVLIPQALQPGNHSVTRPYNISLGPALSNQPVISMALTLLGLLQPTISLEDAGKLLRSPFIVGWAEEASARALLDGRLRQTGELYLTLKTLRYHAMQSDKLYACPVLAEHLGAWIQTAKNCPSIDSPGRWSERFAGVLTKIGWAKGRPLSSDEFQATEAWRDLLVRFASLELVTKPMDLSTAVAQLQRMAEERTFQPQTAAVPIQVMGLLEVNGLQFDSIWVMGLDDIILPASPRPNPFIPLHLQRDGELPRSSEERELQVSRTITNRLLTSAAEVIVSHPQRSGDEELRASPLITHLTMMNSADVSQWSTSTWRNEVYHSSRLIQLEDDPAPPLENEDVNGGSAVFKLQAACPFRAFAELRLGARALEHAEIGLNAMTRGSLMHRVLEKIWDALVSHEQLIKTDHARLEVIVSSVVNQVIEEIANRYPQTLNGRFREIENQRLCQQVFKWLELEKQRKSFSIIEKEEKHEATAGGIRVQLKIDRIDQLSDGRKLVIDYKTGSVHPGQWFGERPEEPQLPLYSMAVDGDIAGVLFAQVKAGGMAFNGVTEEEDLVPGVKSYEKLTQTRETSEWKGVMRDWQATMETLGQAYRNGEALVDPKKYPGTCTYCELKPLCRIHELNLLNTGLGVVRE